MTPAPTIETQRLILRGPVESDFEPMARFFADEKRTAGFGGTLPRDQAWRWFATTIGHWHIRGYGFWTITLKEDDRVCGFTGIWDPEGWPEPELGWVMYEGFEGKGIAAEAAIAARAHAYAKMGFTTLTSNIVPDNDRSIALAKRLGAVLERTYDNVQMGKSLMFRHPAPEALA